MKLKIEIDLSKLDPRTLRSEVGDALVDLALQIEGEESPLLTPGESWTIKDSLFSVIGNAMLAESQGHYHEEESKT